MTARELPRRARPAQSSRHTTAVPSSRVVAALARVSRALSKNRRIERGSPGDAAVEAGEVSVEAGELVSEALALPDGEDAVVAGELLSGLPLRANQGRTPGGVSRVSGRAPAASSTARVCARMCSKRAGPSRTPP